MPWLKWNGEYSLLLRLCRPHMESMYYFQVFGVVMRGLKKVRLPWTKFWDTQGSTHTQKNKKAFLDGSVVDFSVIQRELSALTLACQGKRKREKVKSTAWYHLKAYSGLTAVTICRSYMESKKSLSPDSKFSSLVILVYNLSFIFY